MVKKLRGIKNKLSIKKLSIKKISIKHLLLILSCILAFILCYSMSKLDNSKENESLVNRAQVAKAVALMFHSMSDIESNTEDYYKSDSNEWYEKYMNVMYREKYFNIEDIKATEKEALKTLKYSDINSLFEKLGLENEELWSHVRTKKGSSLVRQKEWATIYQLMVKVFGKEKEVLNSNIIISGTIANDSSLPKWVASTSGGQFKFDGLSVDYYIDREINVLHKDGQIICILGVNSEKITYHNAFILSASDGKVKAYTEGTIREFSYKDKKTDDEIKLENVVADIIMDNKKIVDIIFKTDTIAGKVLAISSSYMELENKGIYNIDDNCKIYKLYGNIEKASMSDILVGYEAQKLVLGSDGRISAIIIDEDVTATNIRVLIKTDGFGDIYHQQVTISSEKGCQISYNNGAEVYELAEGMKYSFKADNDYLKKGRVKITSNGVDGKINIASLKRGYGNPSYRGDIELLLTENGIVIINELPLEEYLYSVVPSEMPSSYNYEALKAQAICARSFAYIHILGNRYSEFGAHVDDSTSFQVYNNSAEQEVTNRAVDETYGQILKNGDNVISAYFYSTSCGHTTSAIVWGNELPYIKGKFLASEEGIANEKLADINLTNEKEFDSFIRTAHKTYDSDYVWYRWNVSMTLEELANNINANLSKVKEANIQVLSENGQWENKKTASVGKVKKIETGERGPGGVLKYITITGTDCTVRIHKEYNIRTVISPKGATIKRGTGSDISTMVMLPSGFFVVDDIYKDSALSGYTFIGGGYGHGAGMSQNGANTMAKLGMDSTAILEFFYTETRVEKIY